MSKKVHPFYQPKVYYCWYCSMGLVYQRIDVAGEKFLTKPVLYHPVNQGFDCADRYYEMPTTLLQESILVR